MQRREFIGGLGAAAAGAICRSSLSYAQATGSVAHRTIQANDTHLHFVEQGEGPLVVLCHGFPELWHSWRYQLPALSSAGFRAVAVDMRGYGRSDRPEAIDQYTLMHLVGIRRGLTITSEAVVSTSYPDVIFRPITGEDAMIRFSAVSLRSNGNPALRRLLSLARAQAKKEKRNGTPTSNAHRSGRWSLGLVMALLSAFSRRLGLSA